MAKKPKHPKRIKPFDPVKKELIGSTHRPKLLAPTKGKGGKKTPRQKLRPHNVTSGDVFLCFSVLCLVKVEIYPIIKV